MSLSSAETGRKRLRTPDGVGILLRDLVHERTGLFFEDSRVDFLLEKLEPAGQSRGCESFLEYYYALKENAAGEWERAWEALSVQETYFWREMAQIHALVEVLIPKWLQEKRSKYQIWSAACATGEEPYSIVIALMEAGLTDLPVEVMASDASPAALAKAGEAIYRERSFRALPLPLRQKYFEPAPEGWKLADHVRKRVTFRRANLLDIGEIAPFSRAQAIFCRNAFIYFSRHAIRQAVAMMAKSMAPGGHLFLGASESLWRLTTDFELREIRGALIYERI